MSLYTVIFCLYCCFNTISLSSQPQDHDVYILGHSLVNFTMPEMFNDLADDAGYDHNYQSTVGNGANLSWQWTNPYTAQGDFYPDVLPTGLNDVFIVTEAVPLKPHLQWSNTYEYADSFYSMAAQYRPDIKFFVYETWHCTDSGNSEGCDWDPEDHLPWRDRLTLDLPAWQGIVDHVNDLHPSANAQLVPAGQAMAALYDSIALGTVPGIDNITDLFSDNIHLTEIGNYYIACVMFATIYQQSPEGLTNQTTNIWGVDFPEVPADLALKMQQTAWATVCNFFNWSCCIAPPTPAIAGQQIACKNNTYTYTTAYNAGNAYNWLVTGGNILTGQGSNTITVQWNNSGEGSVTVEESY
ncbi:MAG: hypothetical protein IPQ28_11740 [Sphingobacteriales bacterium]|nr:hypothetical protein [Sphingobacteriales bacterium]MBL0248227.1 hypothetical protein [Sphingobacteriales bacterium]HMS51082.1 hypothetical protein [Chitinophagales bacterium]